MSEDHKTVEELLGIERSLRALAPRSSSVDRDAVMFAAGIQAAAKRSRWRGPVLACASAVVGLAFGFATGRMPDRELPVAQRPEVEAFSPAVEIVEADEPYVPLSEYSNVVLRGRMLSGDFDSIVDESKPKDLPDAPPSRSEIRRFRDFDKWIDPPSKHS